jgi:hypothetical protein
MNSHIRAQDLPTSTELLILSFIAVSVPITVIVAADDMFPHRSGFDLHITHVFATTSTPGLPDLQNQEEGVRQRTTSLFILFQAWFRLCLRE